MLWNQTENHFRQTSNTAEKKTKKVLNKRRVMPLSVIYEVVFTLNNEQYSTQAKSLVPLVSPYWYPKTTNINKTRNDSPNNFVLFIFSIFLRKTFVLISICFEITLFISECLWKLRNLFIRKSCLNLFSIQQCEANLK